jgi:hypothetical protein
MRKELIWSIVIGIVTLALGQGIFYKVYNNPDMTYEILPVHRIGNQQTYGIIIKNEGNVLLHNILISLKSKLPIQKIRLDGPEIMDTSGLSYLVSGKIGEKTVQLKMDRIVTKSNYNLTIMTEADSPIDVMIASDEVVAKEEIPRKSSGIFASALLSLLAGLTAFTFSWVLKVKQSMNKMKQRVNELVNESDCHEKRVKTGMKLINFYKDVIGNLQNMLGIINIAKETYGDKDNFLQLIQKYEKLHYDMINLFQAMSEEISTDGVCFDLKKEE